MRYQKHFNGLCSGIVCLGDTIHSFSKKNPVSRENPNWPPKYTLSNSLRFANHHIGMTLSVGRKIEFRKKK